MTKLQHDSVLKAYFVHFGSACTGKNIVCEVILFLFNFYNNLRIILFIFQVVWSFSLEERGLERYDLKAIKAQGFVYRVSHSRSLFAQFFFQSLNQFTFPKI